MTDALSFDATGPAWTVVAFTSGSVPLSLLVARYALRVDLRAVADGNPGATNVFRAGGKAWGMLALLLDVLKAAAPVGLAFWVAELNGPWLTATAVAPVAGHAFSPFLNFRGGKAIAALFGVWCGLTLFVGPIVLGAALGLWHRFIQGDAWVVVAMLATGLIVLVLVGADFWLTTAGLLQTGVVLWKHRRELRTPPRLKTRRSLSASPEGSAGG
ncbi:MAG: glycerol-3-phosphate acyltransferase [Planctomycetia bacterium]